MNIYGKKVVIRAIEENDIKLVVNLFNDPEVEGKVIGWSFPLSVYEQHRWMESNYKDKNNLRFVIENETGVGIGIVTLTDIDWRNRKASTGIKILNPEMRGKGYGKDAIMAIMRYSFDTLGFNRLDTSWFSDNEASRQAHIRCGWKEEGIRKKYIYKNGDYKDLVLAGVLETEYRAFVTNNNYWDN